MSGGPCIDSIDYVVNIIAPGSSCVPDPAAALLLLQGACDVISILASDTTYTKPLPRSMRSAGNNRLHRVRGVFGVPFCTNSALLNRYVQL